MTESRVSNVLLVAILLAVSVSAVGAVQGFFVRSNEDLRLDALEQQQRAMRLYEAEYERAALSFDKKRAAMDVFMAKVIRHETDK